MFLTPPSRENTTSTSQLTVRSPIQSTSRCLKFVKDTLTCPLFTMFFALGIILIVCAIQFDSSWAAEMAITSFAYGIIGHCYARYVDNKKAAETTPTNPYHQHLGTYVIDMPLECPED